LQVAIFDQNQIKSKCLPLLLTLQANFQFKFPFYAEQEELLLGNYIQHQQQQQHQKQTFVQINSRAEQSGGAVCIAFDISKICAYCRCLNFNFSPFYISTMKAPAAITSFANISS
jgi:predicted transcriptional regulator YheO